MHSRKLAAAIGMVVLVGLFALRFEARSILSAGLGLVGGAPMGSDPLTTQEVDTVVAAAAPAVLARTATAYQELLLVERHDPGKTKDNPPRQGDLFVYDYATDTLIHRTVDVTSGKVTAVEQLQGVQLPLNTNEETRALALIQADAALWQRLARRYQEIAGEPLTRIDQLQVKISVFHADTMPDRLNAAAQQCGRHRCAQVLLFTVDKTLLEIMPIVDLSSGQVTQTLNAQ